LTLLAQGTIPDVILLEDANDLTAFLEATKRTVGRSWCDEVVNARNAAWADSFF
jgi:hypothetical protein